MGNDMDRNAALMMGIATALATDHAHRVFNGKSRSRDQVQKKKNKRATQKASRKRNRK